MLISIPCHIFCSGKRLPIPAARPYLSVYIVSAPPPPSGLRQLKENPSSKIADKQKSFRYSFLHISKLKGGGDGPFILQFTCSYHGCYS